MAPSQNKSKKPTGPKTFVVDASIPIRDQLIVGEQFVSQQFCETFPKGNTS